MGFIIFTMPRFPDESGSGATYVKTRDPLMGFIICPEPVFACVLA